MEKRRCEFITRTLRERVAHRRVWRAGCSCRQKEKKKKRKKGKINHTPFSLPFCSPFFLYFIVTIFFFSLLAFLFAVIFFSPPPLFLFAPPFLSLSSFLSLALFNSFITVETSRTTSNPTLSSSFFCNDLPRFSTR